MDVDPIFCEITIRRIERFLETGKLGWQNGNPFEKELGGSLWKEQQKVFEEFLLVKQSYPPQRALF